MSGSYSQHWFRHHRVQARKYVQETSRRSKSGLVLLDCHMAATMVKLGARLIPWMEGTLLPVLLLTLLQSHEGIRGILYTMSILSAILTTPFLTFSRIQLPRWAWHRLPLFRLQPQRWLWWQGRWLGILQIPMRVRPRNGPLFFVCSILWGVVDRRHL